MSTSSFGAFSGGNSWTNYGGEPSAVPVGISTGTDGSVWIVDSNSNMWAYNLATGLFQAMPGSAKQITMGASNTILALNSAGSVWRYNPITNSWNSFPGTLTVVSSNLDLDGHGTYGANGSNVYWWDPYNKVWTFEETMPNTVVNIDSTIESAAILVDSTGAMWEANQVTKQFYKISDGSGYNGKPIKYSGGYVLTSTGALYNGLKQQITGTYSDISVDSEYDVWVITNGTVERFLPTANYSFGSFSNYYVSLQAANDITNLPEGVLYNYTNTTDVYLDCTGQQPQLLFTTYNAWKSEFAHTRSIKTQLTTQWEDSWGKWWGSWDVNQFCDADHYPPDFNPQFVNDYLQPTPWGWDAFDFCFSTTGTQPFTCGTAEPVWEGGLAWKWTSSRPRYACTSHPI